MPTAVSRTTLTYRYELWRASTAGILETAGSTFLLLIAVQYFQASAVEKGLVAAGGSVGLLLSPVVVSSVTAAGWPPSLAAGRICAAGAAAFLLAAAVPTRLFFILASVVAMAAAAAVVPLLTQMYQENYPETERGRRFSRTVMVRIAAAALFSQVAGDALNGHLQRFPALLLVFGLALGFASFCLARCPTDPIPPDGGAHPLRALRYAREDRLFRRTLVTWMLMGFANLMMLPLRVEYLANPKYQQGASVVMVALLTGVIPNVVRLGLSPVWGHLFDRMNFFALRVTLNAGFAIGILTFFLSDTLTGLVAGAVVFGISNAGGDVAWSLWVTKFAPPGRVADYMSVHTFLTGVRGVLAPLCAFWLVTRWAPWQLALVSTSLIALASLLLLPEVKWGAKARRSPALVEEISE
jgi:MFS family permease